MTKEVALEILSHDRERLIDYRGSDYSGVEALDMAIKAFEQGTEKEKIKNVIIGAINDNAEAMQKLRSGVVLLNEDEHQTYWNYLIGRRVALFECYLILEESSNGKN